MAEFPWSSVNWFDFLQTVALVGSLLVAAAAANREARAQEDKNLFALAEKHQALSDTALARPDLERVFREDIDVLAEPATAAEAQFLNAKIVHYLTSWRIARPGAAISKQELAADLRGFFSLPLARAVWEKTKGSRNPRFVRFVTHAIEGKV